MGRHDGEEANEKMRHARLLLARDARCGAWWSGALQDSGEVGATAAPAPLGTLASVVQTESAAANHVRMVLAGCWDLWWDRARLAATRARRSWRPGCSDFGWGRCWPAANRHDSLVFAWHLVRGDIFFLAGR